MANDLTLHITELRDALLGKRSAGEVAKTALAVYEATALGELAVTLQHDDFAEAGRIAARLLACQGIESDDVASAITDSGKVCAVAKKSAEDALKRVTGSLRETDQRARSIAAPVIDGHERAVDHAKDLLGAWSREKARRAETERRERERIEREERERVAREQAEADRIRREEEARVARETEAAAKIAAEGMLPVPEVAPIAVPEVRPAEVPAVNPTLAVPTQTRGTGSLASVRRNPPTIVAFDMVKIAASHPEWLTLDTKAARAGFAAVVKRITMKMVYEGAVTPEPNAGELRAIEVFAEHGMRVTFDTTVALR